MHRFVNFSKKKAKLNMSVMLPSFLAVNSPDIDADQQTGGDKAGISVPVIAAVVGGLILLIVVVVVVVLLRRRFISAFTFLQLNMLER